MTDITYSRFVDEQRAQIRWLFAQAAKQTPQDISLVAKKSLKSALVNAMELALIGFFGERTQRRFNREIWHGLLKAGASFQHLIQEAPCPDYLVSYWLTQEQQPDSALLIVQNAIELAKTPEEGGYQSGLLSITSLADASAAPVDLIATSRQNTPASINDLQLAWQALETQMASERAQALEC